jgi:hypothetical protein
LSWTRSRCTAGSRAARSPPTTMSGRWASRYIDSTGTGIVLKVYHLFFSCERRLAPPMEPKRANFLLQCPRPSKNYRYEAVCRSKHCPAFSVPYLC